MIHWTFSHTQNIYIYICIGKSSPMHRARVAETAIRPASSRRVTRWAFRDFPEVGRRSFLGFSDLPGDRERTWEWKVVRIHVHTAGALGRQCRGRARTKPTGLVHPGREVCALSGFRLFFGDSVSLVDCVFLVGLCLGGIVWSFFWCSFLIFF